MTEELASKHLSVRLIGRSHRLLARRNLPVIVDEFLAHTFFLLLAPWDMIAEAVSPSSSKVQPRSTMLNKEMTELIVSIGGLAIRDFLAKLAPYADNVAASPYVNLGPKTEVWMAVRRYISNPEEFSDEKLTREVTGMPRIELRGKGRNGEAAQVAIIGIPDQYRYPVLQNITNRLRNRGVSVLLDGTMTLAVNMEGVDRSLPIDYLSRHWDEVLAAAKYTPGTYIDARQTRTVVIADAEGTTYGKPTATMNPILADSIARGQLIEYLKAGGVYVVISGYDMEATRRRLLDNDGIPASLRHRVIVVADGSASMAVLSASGKSVPLPKYQTMALAEVGSPLPVQDLDAIYLADDEPNT